MVKTFCDKCGKEVKKNGRFNFKLGDFMIETMECVKRVWNGGHLCLDCVKEIVAKGEVNERI